MSVNVQKTVIPWRPWIQFGYWMGSFYVYTVNACFDPCTKCWRERGPGFQPNVILSHDEGMAIAKVRGIEVEAEPSAYFNISAADNSLQHMMDDQIKKSLEHVWAITDAELIKRIGTALDPNIRQVVREEMAKTLPSSDVVERDCKGLLEAVVNAPTHTQHDNAMTAAASALTAARTNGGGK